MQYKIRLNAISPKLAKRLVMQENAKSADGVLTPTYAKRNTPVTTAEIPIIHLLPMRVFTDTAADNGPTIPTADVIQ